MTTTQKAFNNVQTRINELTDLRPFTFGFEHGDLLATIKALETKLAEIAMELTAERYATEY
jgi:hypothetical protein